MGAGESWQCQNRGEAVIGCVVVDELKASGVWSMNTGFEAAVAVKQQMIYCTLFCFVFLSNYCYSFGIIFVYCCGYDLPAINYLVCLVSALSKEKKTTPVKISKSLLLSTLMEGAEVKLLFTNEIGQT